MALLLSHIATRVREPPPMSHTFRRCQVSWFTLHYGNACPKEPMPRRLRLPVSHRQKRLSVSMDVKSWPNCCVPLRSRTVVEPTLAPGPARLIQYLASRNRTRRFFSGSVGTVLSAVHFDVPVAGSLPSMPLANPGFSKVVAHHRFGHDYHRYVAGASSTSHPQ